MLLDYDYIAYLDENNFYDRDHLELMYNLVVKDKLDWTFSLRKIIDTEGKRLVVAFRWAVAQKMTIKSHRNVLSKRGRARSSAGAPLFLPVTAPRFSSALWDRPWIIVGRSDESYCS